MFTDSHSAHEPFCTKSFTSISVENSNPFWCKSNFIALSGYHDFSWIKFIMLMARQYIYNMSDDEEDL